MQEVQKVREKLSVLKKQMENDKITKEKDENEFMDAFHKLAETVPFRNAPEKVKPLLQKLDTEMLEMARLLPALRNMLDTQFQLNRLGGEKNPGNSIDTVPLKIERGLLKAVENPKVKDGIAKLEQKLGMKEGSLIPMIVGFLREGIANYLSLASTSPFAPKMNEIGKRMQWRIACDNERKNRGLQTALAAISLSPAAPIAGAESPALMEASLNLPSGTEDRWSKCYDAWVAKAKLAKNANPPQPLPIKPSIQNAISQDAADKYLAAINPQAAPAAGAKTPEKPADAFNGKNELTVDAPATFTIDGKAVTLDRQDTARRIKVGEGAPLTFKNDANNATDVKLTRSSAEQSASYFELSVNGAKHGTLGELVGKIAAEQAKGNKPTSVSFENNKTKFQ